MTTDPRDEFTLVFRQEHRTIRDLLLDLSSAFRDGDTRSASALVHEVAERTGPHFRYEEERLYPSLVPLFGEEYVEKLLADHDGAIRSSARLAELAERDAITEAESAEAVDLVRGILPHVSDCDGLSIFVETLPPDEVRSILDARADANDVGVPLLEWARHIRVRSPELVA